MKKKPKYPNFPPVRSPSEEFLRLCREKSDATGVPLSFVQRRALEDWLGGLYDPTVGKGHSDAVETQKLVNAVAEVSAEHQRKSAGEPPPEHKMLRRFRGPIPKPGERGKR